MKSVRLLIEHPLYEHCSSRACHFPDVHQNLTNSQHILPIIRSFSILRSRPLMTEFNRTPEETAKIGKVSGKRCQPSLGLPTATFVVVAGMVGAGVLTTSGYTVCARRQQPVDAAPLGLGGNHGGLRSVDACRAVGGSPQDGGRLRLPLRSLWAVARVFIGMGLVSDRVCRSERGVGVCVCEIHPGAVSGSRARSRLAASGCSPRAAIADFRRDSCLGTAHDSQGAGWITS